MLLYNHRQILLTTNTQVGLVHPGEKVPWCGGALVSKQHVLTAAHCTRGHLPATIEVLVGEHDTSDAESDRRSVSNITEHPDYNHTTADMDVSILTLTDPLNISTTAAPICLPASNESLYINQTATVVGWGDTSHEGTPSSILQEVNVTTMANAQCRDSYGSEIQKYVIMHRTIIKSNTFHKDQTNK